MATATTKNTRSANGTPRKVPVARKSGAGAKTAARGATPARKASSHASTVETVAAPATEAPSKQPDGLTTNGPAAPATTDAPARASNGATPSDKQRLIRDSFTMPRHEYALLDAMKARLLKRSKAAKKSELLRAGVVLLASFSDDELLAAIDRVPSLKTGRPKKTKDGAKNGVAKDGMKGGVAKDADKTAKKKA